MGEISYSHLAPARKIWASISTCQPARAHPHTHCIQETVSNAESDLRNQLLCVAVINTTVCRPHVESSSKILQIHPPPASPFTSTHPHPEPAQPLTTTTVPTPPLGPLQPAACLWRSPLTSAARLGRVPAQWALAGCGWSEKQSAMCRVHGTDSTRPAQTHQMTREHRRSPFPLPFVCPSHTLTIKGNT